MSQKPEMMEMFMQDPRMQEVMAFLYESERARGGMSSPALPGVAPLRTDPTATPAVQSAEQIPSPQSASKPTQAFDPKFETLEHQ